MTDRLTGGCFCGAVRFEVEGPETFACFCHCRSCQRAVGAPVVAWATYRRETFRLNHGEMQTIHSSPGVTRGFCATCGSSITYEHAKRGDEIDVTVNCLDDPSAPAMQAHIWTEDRQPWLTIDDGLPVYEKNSG